jgi:pectate lyase
VKSSSSVAPVSSSSQGQVVSGTATLTKHGSGSTTQTVAAGESIADFYFTIAGATGATVTGLPDGVTGTLKGSDFYISGTVSATAAAGAYKFTVTTTGATTNASKSGTITVVASGTAPASSSSASKDPEPAEGSSSSNTELAEESSSSMELPNSSESGTTILSQVAGVRANLSVEGRTVVVHGISQNTAPIYLFDQQGRLVAKSLASENCAIAVPRAGTYLVRIGHETHRIIVR